LALSTITTFAEQQLQSIFTILKQKNLEIALIAAEIAEIDLCQQLDTLIDFLKIRACVALQGTP
jgi:hypothetical protein